MKHGIKFTTVIHGDPDMVIEINTVDNYYPNTDYLNLQRKHLAAVTRAKSDLESAVLHQELLNFNLQPKIWEDNDLTNEERQNLIKLSCNVPNNFSDFNKNEFTELIDFMNKPY